MTTKTRIQSTAEDMAEKTRAAAKDAAQQVRDQAHAQANEAKASVAEEVKSVSSALRTASDEMRSGSPQERIMGQIAGTLADVSDTIRDQDLSEMVSAASRFARRNPMIFLGSAAFLGFAAARFAKSSNSSQHGHDEFGGGYGRGDDFEPGAVGATAHDTPRPQTTSAYPDSSYPSSGGTHSTGGTGSGAGSTGGTGTTGTSGAASGSYGTSTGSSLPDSTDDRSNPTAANPRTRPGETS